tara:strand:- start:1037 stop:1600 length:564 start_codon:yes stop_codon:yes gene_type:complete
MASLETPKCEIGWKAKNFNLLGVDGRYYDLDTIRGENGLLIMFICNHCPYVKAIIDRIVRDTTELLQYGINTIAIMSNDPTDYPEDSFDNMALISKKFDFSFPYVLDKSQQIAKTYGAVCTPDFFGFNSNLELQYRGRLDASRKESADINARRELFESMIMIAQTSQGPNNQIPSIGCSIKWRETSV